ncbi:CoA transferase [Arthrobacter dokdonensis]|uniref:CoA transferase n=1 Tax=Arthrobacter dokdonellae TaxID=2211210 RepID=UPI001D1309AE|nr:CoA transferase [Arthrobacter dokdonellae]
MACGNDGQFTKLARVLGIPDIAVDPRFATNNARVAHRQKPVRRQIRNPITWTPAIPLRTKPHHNRANTTPQYGPGSKTVPPQPPPHPAPDPTCHTGPALRLSPNGPSVASMLNFVLNPNTEHRTPNTEHRTPNTEHRSSVPPSCSLRTRPAGQSHHRMTGAWRPHAGLGHVRHGNCGTGFGNPVTATYRACS